MWLIWLGKYSSLVPNAKFISGLARNQDNYAGRISASTWQMNEERNMSLLGLAGTSWLSIGGFSWASLISDRGLKQFAHDPKIALTLSRNDIELLAFLLTIWVRGVYVEVQENPVSDWNSLLKPEPPCPMGDDWLRAACITDGLRRWHQQLLAHNQVPCSSNSYSL